MTRAWRAIACALVLFAVLGTATSRAEEPSYTIIDLGTLGGSSSNGYGLNASGQVAGTSKNTSGQDRAFLWTDSNGNGLADPGEMIDLGTLGGTWSQARAVNDSGQVTGWSWTGSSVNAFLYDGSMTDLGTLTGSPCYAQDVNNAGHVVGESGTGSNRRAFLYDGSMKNLGTLGGSYSGAYGINTAGQVVGQSWTSTGATRAFRWTDTNTNGLADPGEMIDLGALPGAASSHARGINDAGQVVGHCVTPSHAFVWTDADGDNVADAGEMLDLGSPDGSSFANAINASSDIVGHHSPTSGPSRALLWKKNDTSPVTYTTYDLSSLIPSDSDWTVLLQALDINDSAQIVGYGTIGGQTHAFLLTPAPTNAPPVVDAGGPYSVNEGDDVALTATGSDPDEDVLTYAWDLDNDGIFEEPGQSVDFSAAALDGPSTHTVTVQATDDGGLSATDEATVEVLNVAPTIVEISAPLEPKEVDTTINVSAIFTDPGVADTHTAVWDWGNTATSPGSVDQEAGSVTGSYPYTTPGVYTVTLTVTDDDGGSAQAIFQYVVVYDPEGGFVTGGGWITSPEGACAADPALTGKASFGFNSKYKKNAEEPTGQTQFNFHVAGLDFHSTSYQWLIIAGPQAKYKGSGTINGGGDYGFLITAIDGQQPGGGDVDKFRIKIWDKATEAIVYDNQMGEDDGSDAATALGGGSIVIHKPN
jgi:probable HAF family extracellular repeat protein